VHAFACTHISHTNRRAEALDRAGYHSVTSELLWMNIRGQHGRSLQEHWSDGPRTNLGVQFSNFPNLWAIMGPHNPAVFRNIPRCVETNVEWIVDCIRYMRKNGFETMTATPEAEDAWTKRCYESAKNCSSMKCRIHDSSVAQIPRTCVAASCYSLAACRSIARFLPTLLRRDMKASSCASCPLSDGFSRELLAPRYEIGGASQSVVSSKSVSSETSRQSSRS
jgi:hypothetical protein